MEGIANFNLKEKNILVTGGGGTGVGAGVCKVLSNCGANIILNELNFEKARKAVHRYPNAIPVEGDIGNQHSIMIMFEEIKRKVGVIHGLVNNAGVGLCKAANEATEEEFDRLYDVDIKGLWQVSKAFVNQLLVAGERGNIVNISSIHAHSTMSRYAIYASAKSAVEGLTRGMSVEMGKYQIRVNAVGPGHVHAEQNYDLMKTWTKDPQKWVKDFVTNYQALPYEIIPEDCGNVVAFLLSDLSRSVTGQSIYIDNGTTSMLLSRDFTEI